MEQNGDGNDDDYPGRGFSFAGAMAPQPAPTEDMSDLKAKLKE